MCQRLLGNGEGKEAELTISKRAAYRFDYNAGKNGRKSLAEASPVAINTLKTFRVVRVSQVQHAYW